MNNNNTKEDKMNKEYKYFIGVDVSKYKLDIYNSKDNSYTTIKDTEKDINKYIKH